MAMNTKTVDNPSTAIRYNYTNIPNGQVESVCFVVSIQEHKEADGKPAKYYRVAVLKHQAVKGKLHNWLPKLFTLSEAQLKNELAHKGKMFINAKLNEHNDIVGTAGSLERLNYKVQNALSVVIVSTIEVGDKIVGYRVLRASRNKFNLQTVKAKELYGYCARCQDGIVPIQNAMFVPETVGADGKRSMTIRSYVKNQFVREVLEYNKPETTPAKVTKDTNKEHAENVKNDRKLTDIFSRAQILQLQLGKKNNIDYRLYANPKFDPNQMKELREAMESGVNPRLYASPDFSVDSMRFYTAELLSKSDIRPLLNPKYNGNQLMQLSLGRIAGIDISQYANPNISAGEMEEIRTRLETGMYTTVQIEDTTSKELPDMD